MVFTFLLARLAAADSAEAEVDSLLDTIMTLMMTTQVEMNTNEIDNFIIKLVAERTIHMLHLKIIAEKLLTLLTMQDRTLEMSTLHNAALQTILQLQLVYRKMVTIH
jgi:hypothetical protein